MSAIDDFARLIEATNVGKQILNSLKEEPARLLSRICREYNKTGTPVPDHNVGLYGFMGEAAIAALVSAGLIRKQPGGRTSLYCYEPTAEGISQYEKLKADAFLSK
ncbi:MAG: hypothetical protein PVI95_02650 [Dehalococcoidia bacterium]|jgi:hypothetical protein